MPFIWQAVVSPGGDVIGAPEAAAPQRAGSGLVRAEVKTPLSAEEEHHSFRDVHAMVAHSLKPI